MEYLVFVIYAVVVGQFISSKPTNTNKTGTIRRGHSFYKISGIFNYIIGFCGLFATNLLLRDKNIIPEFFVWIGIFGFALMILYGMYCIFKMMSSPL